MLVYKVKVKAFNPSLGQNGRTDESEHLVFADDMTQALNYVSAMLRDGGWKPEEIRGTRVWLHDIRSLA